MQLIKAHVLSAFIATFLIFADVANAAEKEIDGLPQLDPTWVPSQLLWLAITFVAFYIIFSNKILPELSSIIEGRRQHIQENLDSAEKIKEEAENVHQSYEAILHDAQEKASALYIVADEEIQENIKQAMADFQDRSNKEMSVFEKRLNDVRTEAMEEMNVIAAELASQAAERIIGVRADMEAAKSVVETLNKETDKAKAA